MVISKKKILKALINGVWLKWKLCHWNQLGQKPYAGKLKPPALKNKENHFCIGSSDLSPCCCFFFFFVFFFFFFFFSAGLAGYQNIIERCIMAHSKAISHIYVVYINSAVCKCYMALKQYFFVGLAGYQNIVDRFFIVHIKDTAHIHVFPIKSSICECQNGTNSAIVSMWKI